MDTELIKKGIQNPQKALIHIQNKLKNYSLSPLRIGRLITGSRFPLGTNMYSKDWDLLIVLDACRVDALRAVSDEYSFLNDIESCPSVGTQSVEWMAATFDKKWKEDISKTALVTANPNVEFVFEDGMEGASLPHEKRVSRWGSWDVVPASSFALYKPLWSHGNDIDKGWHSPPKTVTDYGIKIGRKHDYEKIVLHYMQPHSPFIGNCINDDREMNIYETNYTWFLQTGGDKAKVMEAYLNNLRYVLDSISTLLDNINRDKVIITSDHGEAFGEYGIYGHPAGSLHPIVRKVPLASTIATDNNSYKPDPLPEEKVSVEESLEALGYI